jgi:phage protein D
MSEERIIASVESVAEFKISISGEEIPRTVEVLSIHVSKIVNRISFAKIVLQDGDPASGEFENSSGDLFIPVMKLK